MTNSYTAKVTWVPYRPSNGTEGEIFESAFCDRCEHDKDRNCLIHTRALSYRLNEERYPTEWVIPEEADEWPGEAKCTAFQQRTPATHDEDKKEG